MGLDKALGIHDDALLLRSRRATLLASNLANADTPNYKAQDIDFRSALKAASKTDVSMTQTHQRHLVGAHSTEGQLQFRHPHQPSLDGNTVETQVEQALFAENAVQYQASLQFVGNKFKSLSAAIKGE